MCSSMMPLQATSPALMPKLLFQRAPTPKWRLWLRSESSYRGLVMDPLRGSGMSCPAALAARSAWHTDRSCTSPEQRATKQRAPCHCFMDECPARLCDTQKEALWTFAPTRTAAKTAAKDIPSYQKASADPVSQALPRRLGAASRTRTCRSEERGAAPGLFRRSQ